MKENDTIIRPETRDDHRKTENLTREAFWNVYRPGCGEHYVLHCLREDPAFVPELDLVMERDGELIGQVIYLRAEIACDDGRKLLVMTFGPMESACWTSLWRGRRRWARARWSSPVTPRSTASPASFRPRRGASATPTIRRRTTSSSGS